MYAREVEKTGTKTEKQLLFGDADVYTIPASEGWNEGYSHSNKFLYIANSGYIANASMAGKNLRSGVRASSSK